jgi:Sulfotransferase family
MQSEGILAKTDTDAASGQWPSQRFACIVGAPRCGTTTLSRLLASHPDVSFSKVKEPHYFALFDLNALSDEELREAVKTEYLDRYFPEIDPAAEIIAEASVSYLYAPERLRPILRLWPEAKFVIAVRDPLQLIPSLHQRLVYQGDETVTDLERAWRLTAERRRGRKVPRTCLDARQLYYDEAGRLGKNVGHFFEVIGRERCHVVLFDDLKADPGKVYAELLQFLGLRPAPLPPEGNQHRAGQGYRIGWLQRLLKRPPVARTVLAGKHFRRRVASKPHRPPSWVARKIMAGRTALLRWNRAPAPPVRMSAALAREIRDTLHEDRMELSRLLQRDLGHWLGGARPKRAKGEDAA